MSGSMYRNGIPTSKHINKCPWFSIVLPLIVSWSYGRQTVTNFQRTFGRAYTYVWISNLFKRAHEVKTPMYISILGFTSVSQTYHRDFQTYVLNLRCRNNKLLANSNNYYSQLHAEQAELKKISINCSNLIKVNFC